MLEVSKFGQPLDESVRRHLELHLRYTHVEHLYGMDRVCPWTNQIRHVKTVDRQLYRYDGDGRMICGAGLKHRVTTLLADISVPHHLAVQDVKRARPACYVPDWENVRKNFEFRARQLECLQSIEASDCGLIEAVTGFGKMVIIAMICLLYPRAKINIVTRRKAIVNKLTAFLSRWIANVGQVGAGKRSYERVTVYTAASLSHCEFDADFLICDEAHELLAEQSSAWLAKSKYTRNFALTASPRGRADGADVRLESLFGPCIFHLSYPEAVNLGLVVPIRVEWSDVHCDVNPCSGKQGTPKERAGIWRNAVRNQVIADAAASFGDDEQVQILVKTIEHAVYLRQHLPGYTLVYDAMEMSKLAGYINRSMLPENEPVMTPARREMLRKAFEKGELLKVISTNVWAVGVDPTQLTAMIRADATSSEIMDIQAPGRVSRTHTVTGKQVGIVRDFRDQFDSGYANKAKVRYRHYKAMGWDQT